MVINNRSCLKWFIDGFDHRLPRCCGNGVLWQTYSGPVYGVPAWFQLLMCRIVRYRHWCIILYTPVSLQVRNYVWCCWLTFWDTGTKLCVTEMGYHWFGDDVMQVRHLAIPLPKSKRLLIASSQKLSDDDVQSANLCRKTCWILVASWLQNHSMGCHLLHHDSVPSVATVLTRLRLQGHKGRITEQMCPTHPKTQHYGDVIIGAMASQITSLTIVYSTVYSDADQRKHQSSASLAFVRGIHRWPVNSLHKWPVTRNVFPFDDVIMNQELSATYWLLCFGRAGVLTAVIALNFILELAFG